MAFTPMSLKQGDFTYTYDIEAANAAADTPKVPEVSQEEYFRLVKDLVQNGQLAQKHEGLYVLPLLPTYRVITQTDTLSHETATTIGGDADKLMAFDPQIHTQQSALAASRMIMDVSNMGRRSVMDPNIEAALNSGRMKEVVGIEAPGLWSMPRKNLLADYDNTTKDGDVVPTYTVKPTTSRLVTDIDHDITIPVPWGDFTINAGGTLAIRPEHLPDVVKAIQEVESGRTPVSEAFYQADGKSKFDIYGMMPGFRDTQYGNVETGKLPEADAQVASARQALKL